MTGVSFSGAAPVMPAPRNIPSSNTSGACRTRRATGGRQPRSRPLTRDDSAMRALDWKLY
jgi:hypothetical protein